MASGHEEEFVIVSAVRTDRPGFLSVQRRNNVMLSRCTTGMIVVTNKSFLTYNDSSAKTLLGKLVNHWAAATPSGSVWIDWRSITSQSANLPGVYAPKPAPAPQANPNRTYVHQVQRSQTTVGIPPSFSVIDTNSSRRRGTQAVAQLDAQFRGLAVSLPPSHPPPAPVNPFPALGGAGVQRSNRAKGLKG